MGRILFFVALAVAMWVAWTLSRRRNSLDNEERRELKRLRAKEREAQGKSREPSRRGDGQVRPLRPLLSQTRGRAQQGARLLLEALPRCGAGRAMTSPDRAFDGWLPGVVRRPSPHFNERPEGALVSLAVLHFISLPAGRFGGEDVDALFMGTLDAMNPPRIRVPEGPEGLLPFLRAPHGRSQTVCERSGQGLACWRLVLRGAHGVQRLFRRNRARGHGRDAL